MHNENYVRSILKNVIIFNVIKHEVENDYKNAEKNLEILKKYKQLCINLREKFKTSAAYNSIYERTLNEIFLGVLDLNLSLNNLRDSLFLAKNNITVK